MCEAIKRDGTQCQREPKFWVQISANDPKVNSKFPENSLVCANHLAPTVKRYETFVRQARSTLTRPVVTVKNRHVSDKGFSYYV